MQTSPPNPLGIYVLEWVTAIAALVLVIYGLLFMINRQWADRFLRWVGNLLLNAIRAIGRATIHLAEQYPLAVGIVIVALFLYLLLRS